MIDRFKNNKAINHELMIKYWRENPVEAARDILGVQLDTHQQIVLNAWWTHDTSHAVLSRGTGKTYMGAVFCILQAILYPGQRVGIIAPSFRQSKFVFAEIEKLYDKSPVFQEACTKEPTKQPEACVVKFDAASGQTGSIIEALPMGTDGSKIRGARYYRVFADEVAQIDSDTLDTVVSGFMATSADPMGRVIFIKEQMAAGRSLNDIKLPAANKLVLASTAFFQYNHWWHRISATIKLLSQGKYDAERSGKDVSRFKCLGGGLNGGQIPHRMMTDGKECLLAFIYTDPSAGFMDMDRVKSTMAKMSSYKALMEYSAYFPPDSEGFFLRSLLDKCRTHKQFTCRTGPVKGMTYVMGIDPARSSDNFAISLLEVDAEQGVINLVRVSAWNKKSFPHMHHEIRKMVKHYGVKHIGMDAGGGGTAIRDLLANKENCPVGERLILEKGFDEHMLLVGDKILYPLIQFSSSDWTHDSNFTMLSGLQHGRFRIAAKSDNTNLIWTPEIEELEDEMEEALQEWSSIVVMSAGTRMRWDTPTESMRKDRYSSILIGYWIAHEVLGNASTPQAPAMGGWVG